METGTAIAVFAGVYLFNHLSGMALSTYLKILQLKSEEQQAKDMAKRPFKMEGTVEHRGSKN